MKQAYHLSSCSPPGVRTRPPTSFLCTHHGGCHRPASHTGKPPSSPPRCQPTQPQRQPHRQLGRRPGALPSCQQQAGACCHQGASTKPAPGYQVHGALPLLAGDSGTASDLLIAPSKSCSGGLMDGRWEPPPRSREGREGK